MTFAPARIDAVVLVGRPPPGVAGDAVTLAVEEVLGLVPEDDELADGDALTAPALAGRMAWLWRREVGSEVWDRLVAHVAAGPGDVGIVGITGSGPAPELMIRAVQENGGYTFAPASYLRRTPPTGLVARPFDPPLELPLVLAWRGVPGRALEQLLRRLPR